MYDQIRTGFARRIHYIHYGLGQMENHWKGKYGKSFSDSRAQSFHIFCEIISLFKDCEFISIGPLAIVITKNSIRTANIELIKSS